MGRKKKLVDVRGEGQAAFALSAMPAFNPQDRLMTRGEVLMGLVRYLAERPTGQNESAMRLVIELYRTNPELFFNLGLVGLPGGKNDQIPRSLESYARRLRDVRTGFQVRGNETSGYVALLEVGKQPINFHGVSQKAVQEFCQELYGTREPAPGEGKRGRMVGTVVSKARVEYLLGET